MAEAAETTGGGAAACDAELGQPELVANQDGGARRPESGDRVPPAQPLRHHGQIDWATYRQFYLRQSAGWDCGIACTTMILRWATSLAEASAIDTAPFEFQAGTPLWTIDLLCFLRERGVNATMSTSSKGVDDSLSGVPWYDAHLEGDRGRVNAKFRKAEEQAWPVDEVVTATADLAEQLASNATVGPAGSGAAMAIVLVDYSTLDAPGSSLYAGHYIVAVGYDRATDEFLCLDPSRRLTAGHNPRRFGRDVLDRSRAVTGTDWDLIICRAS